MAYDRGLADRVESILRRSGAVEERKMFGGIAFMVNGHMCCGVLKTDLMVRLSPAEAAEALRQPHTRPMDFTGKPMKSLIFVGAHGTDSENDLEQWVHQARSFVLTLPPK